MLFLGDCDDKSPKSEKKKRDDCFKSSRRQVYLRSYQNLRGCDIFYPPSIDLHQDIPLCFFSSNYAKALLR